MVEPHQHNAGCGCAEEAKYADPHGLDLFPHIDLPQVDCFNEHVHGSIKNVIRPLEDKLDFARGMTVSGYGKDLVVYIPFNGEIKVKSVLIIGGDDGTAPSKCKLYKNVEAVDINILEEKKPIQVLDLAENLNGEIDCLVNISKFNNVSNLVLGFDENFGAPRTALRYIGLKGEKLREKVKVVETVYEVRANLADHKNPADKFANASGLGF